MVSVTGKEVVLAGHSLGGSLALLLALDALVNHTYDSSSDDAYSGDDMGENVRGSDSKEENDGNSDHSSRGSGSSSRNSNSNRDHTPPCRPNSGQSTASRTSTYRFTGYSHHNDKRCTGTAHVSVLNKLHIVTFGQPELASPLFFESLKKQHTAAKKLLEER
jgi:Lipase (class 3)